MIIISITVTDLIGELTIYGCPSNLLYPGRHENRLVHPFALEHARIGSHAAKIGLASNLIVLLSRKKKKKKKKKKNQSQDEQMKGKRDALCSVKQMMSHTKWGSLS
jgi:hypothetical protein